METYQLKVKSLVCVFSASREKSFQELYKWFKYVLIVSLLEVKLEIRTNKPVLFLYTSLSNKARCRHGGGGCQCPLNVVTAPPEVMADKNQDKIK